MEQPTRDGQPSTLSCSRCGLRRWTRELAARGIVARFCDECYWQGEWKFGNSMDDADRRRN